MAVVCVKWCSGHEPELSKLFDMVHTYRVHKTLKIIELKKKIQDLLVVKIDVF